MSDTGEKEKQIKVAFYLRVSTDEQKEKYGKDLQLQALELYTKSKGQLENGDEKMILAGKERHWYRFQLIFG